MVIDQRATLIVLSGLPGTGKTTVAKQIACQLGAGYLRIDAIEVDIQDAGIQPVGSAGYMVAQAIAGSNLAIGISIVADCVNPVKDSRLGWREVAAQAGATLVDIHLICGDVAEHRQRVEERTADIPGHRLPTWEEIVRYEFEPRDDEHLLRDTASLSVEDAIAHAIAYVTRRRKAS